LLLKWQHSDSTLAAGYADGARQGRGVDQVSASEHTGVVRAIGSTSLQRRY